MSTKQLRRLAQQKEEERNEESVEDSSEEEITEVRPSKNKFSLLLEDEDDDGVNKEDGDVEESNPVKVKNTSKNKNRKKKNKKNKKEDDDLDDILADINATSSQSIELSEIDRIKNVMKIQWADLNADNELKKVLGSGFKMPLNPQRGRGQRKSLPQFRIIQRDPSWPPVDGSGLSVIPDNGYEEAKPGYKYFKFHHNPAYKETQQLFWDVMNSPEPQLDLILGTSRFHLDTTLVYIQHLVQADDSREARKFTDFGIYICESVMPTGFEMLSPVYGLPYDVRENRSFYMLLMWHLKFLIIRRCFYTALQVAKLIFIKDMTDPLGMCLIIDSLAIRSGSYQFLLDFYEEFKTSHNLDGLPNIKYNMAIATHLLAQEKDDKALAKTADNLLFDALVFYPGILSGICEKMSIKPTPKVIKTLEIDELSLSSTPKGLKLLEQIYIYHNFDDVWKKEGFMTWMETTTENLVNKRGKEMTSLIRENRNKQKQIFIGMAQPVGRHGYLFELYPTTVGIPAVDPLPPLISRAGYLPNERLTIDTTNHDQEEDNVNPERFTITNLLHGLLNTLNPEYQAPNNPQNRPRDAQEEE